MECLQLCELNELDKYDFEFVEIDKNDVIEDKYYFINVNDEEGIQQYFIKIIQFNQINGLTKGCYRYDEENGLWQKDDCDNISCEIHAEFIEKLSFFIVEYF